MPRSVRAVRLRHDLRAITVDGAAFSLMVGAGEQCLVPFALAIGMGEAASGLLASIPQLVGAVLQLISPTGVRVLRSHRAWVVASVATQAACFVPLALAAIAGGMPTILMFVIATLYWGSGAGAGAAWQTWVATLVPVRLRARFFAHRTRVMQVALLVAMILTGFLLHGGAQRGYGTLAFAALFTIAAASRFISAGLLASQNEPLPLPPDHRLVPPGEWLRRLRSSADGRLLTYMLAVQAGTYMSAPFFAAFMLKQMGLEENYAAYVLPLAVGYAAKILTMPLMGRLAKGLGARALCWVGGIGIVPLAAMWVGMLSMPYSYLLFVQVLAGTFWGAYELGTFLFQFETIRQEERTSMMTTFTLANAAALALGSMLGWLGLTLLGEGAWGYYVIFSISSALRGAALLLLARVGRA